ncbi:MAG: winged helix-turn-helix transcriptional regulator [Myxococcales bacterium]|nr:winged helix-turn-helix transcriptional regulator [Myxococcales bacterium]
MTSDTDVRHAALFAALGHPTRLCLLRKLAAGACCVTELTDATDALQPKVSRHLGVLRDAGLVVCRTEGRRRCYRLVDPGLVDGLLALVASVSPGEPGTGGDPA